MLSTAVNSPYGRGLVLAGVVFGAEGPRHRLNDEHQHLGIAARCYPGEGKQDDEDHDGPEKTAEEDLKAATRKQGGGEQCPLNPHDGQGFIQRLVNRIAASRDLGHGCFILLAECRQRDWRLPRLGLRRWPAVQCWSCRFACCTCSWQSG